MKNYSIEDVVSIFEQSGIIMLEATLSGDYKLNNKEGKKLTKVFKYFEKNLSFAKECIEELYKSDNVVVLSKAAAYSLALEYNIDRALNVLNVIANNENNGIFALNAKMTIKVWEEQGFLKIY